MLYFTKTLLKIKWLTGERNNKNWKYLPENNFHLHEKLQPSSDLFLLKVVHHILCTQEYSPECLANFEEVIHLLKKFSINLRMTIISSLVEITFFTFILFVF